MSKSKKLDEIVADLRKGIGPTVIQIWLSTDKTVGELEHRIDEIRRTLADEIESAATCPPPRRNCDVGTPEEHSIRFFEFCKSNASGKGINQSCKPTCPCIDCSDICQCLCRWAQMPYTEGSAK